MLTVSPTSTASRSQISRPCWVMSSCPDTALASRRMPNPSRYLPRSCACSTSSCSSSAVSRPRHRGLVHTDVGREVRHPGLAETSKDLQNGNRAVNRLHTPAAGVGAPVAHRRDHTQVARLSVTYPVRARCSTRNGCAIRTCGLTRERLGFISWYISCRSILEAIWRERTHMGSPRVVIIGAGIVGDEPGRRTHRPRLGPRHGARPGPASADRRLVLACAGVWSSRRIRRRR